MFNFKLSIYFLFFSFHFIWTFYFPAIPWNLVYSLSSSWESTNRNVWIRRYIYYISIVSNAMTNKILLFRFIVKFQSIRNNFELLRNAVMRTDWNFKIENVKEHTANVYAIIFGKNFDELMSAALFSKMKKNETEKRKKQTIVSRFLHCSLVKLNKCLFTKFVTNKRNSFAICHSNCSTQCTFFVQLNCTKLT